MLNKNFSIIRSGWNSANVARECNYVIKFRTLRNRCIHFFFLIYISFIRFARVRFAQCRLACTAPCNYGATRQTTLPGKDYCTVNNSRTIRCVSNLHFVSFFGIIRARICPVWQSRGRSKWHRRTGCRVFIAEFCNIINKRSVLSAYGVCRDLRSGVHVWKSRLESLRK